MWSGNDELCCNFVHTRPSAPFSNPDSRACHWHDHLICSNDPLSQHACGCRLDVHTILHIGDMQQVQMRCWWPRKQFKIFEAAHVCRPSCTTRWRMWMLLLLEKFLIEMVSKCQQQVQKKQAVTQSTCLTLDPWAFLAPVCASMLKNSWLHEFFVKMPVKRKDI